MSQANNYTQKALYAKNSHKSKGEVQEAFPNFKYHHETIYLIADFGNIYNF